LKKNVILVAGVDYEFKGVDFRLFCDNRVKRLLASNNKSKDDMTFQIFDFRKGEVVTQETTFPGGKRTDKITKLSPSPFKAISKANYDATVSGGETHYHFKDGQKGIMSITDIYEAVQKVGINAPNTLVELSFFSHSWMGGPILVNSFDDGSFTINLPPFSTPISLPLPGGMRDPDDMDPRASKDFVPPTMDATQLGNFKKAFHSDGHVWIWGCAFPRLVHEILHKLEHHPKYKDSGLGDDEVFKFTNFNDAQAEVLERFLSGALGGPFPDRKNIEIKFKFLKHFFCLITVASYTHNIAKNANVKAFGGVMGTYSDYDTGPLPLMSVYKGFAKHFTFYKNYLGFTFDPEGRKYGAYLPGFSCPTPSP
jgi:hypothetical protein